MRRPPIERSRHYRVLVADDDERCLDSIVALLSRDGFTIESFHGGLEALHRLGLPETDPGVTDEGAHPRGPTRRGPVQREALPRRTRRAGTPPETPAVTPPMAPPIDFLVLDYNMPDVTGIEVLRRIRIEFGTPLPAILVSGESSRDLERLWLEVGGFALLPKPVVPDAFRREVQRLVHRFFAAPGSDPRRD